MFDEEDRPKLADFGLARSTAGAGTLTDAGTVLGTAAYISPEQAAGEPAGAASDVYSFGVILFRMLTGSLPFTADSAIALVDMHRRAQPPTVESLQPRAPRDLAALTAAALRKDPTQRPADGAALLSALGTTAATVVVPADTEATRVLAPPPAPAAAPPAADPRRKRAIIAAAVVLLAAAGGILAWAVTRPGATTPPTTATHRPTHPTTTQPATSGTTAATSTRQTTTAAPTTTPTTSPTTTQTPTTVPTTTTIPTISTPTTTPTTSGIGTTTTPTGTS
jgi:eukaryotic-like serine/threonine-protein kinase